MGKFYQAALICFVPNTQSILSTIGSDGWCSWLVTSPPCFSQFQQQVMSNLARRLFSCRSYTGYASWFWKKGRKQSKTRPSEEDLVEEDSLHNVKMKISHTGSVRWGVGKYSQRRQRIYFSVCFVGFVCFILSTYNELSQAKKAPKAEFHNFYSLYLLDRIVNYLSCKFVNY